MGDVVIVDEEYLAFADAIRIYGDTVQAAIILYRNEVLKACESAVMGGHFAQNMKLFYDMSSILDNRVSEASRQIESHAERYLEDIDEADEYLYAGSW